MKDIKDLTSEIFACDIADLNNDVLITDLKNWDSLKHMEYIISLENEYNVSLTGDEIASLKKFVNIEDLIKEKLKDSHNLKR